MCTGHSCFPPRKAINGSITVTAGGLQVHCIGDAWMPHRCDKEVHDGVLSQGSPTVTVEGKAVGHVGSTISCGSVVATGLPDVIIG